MALRPRPDGKINVTLDPDAVELLDKLIEPLTIKFGFKPSRSQGLKHLLVQLQKNLEQKGE